ncbi:MAG: hypothetical protein Q8N22_02945 [bacterium]|nr:hypothetical protein [bacterium]
MFSDEVVFGTDLDGVVSLLPFNLKPAKLNSANERSLYRLQESWIMQRGFNFLIRKPNLEIKNLMDELRLKGIRLVIISASNVSYREELKIWLKFHNFSVDDLILKESFYEEGVDYKARVVPGICNFYIDDKEEIVRAINNASNGKCRAILYQPGQTSKDLLKELLPVFV